MMKLTTILFAVLLASCAQLTNGGGSVNPVVLVDAKQKIYSNYCGGSVEDWGNCNDRANKTCANSYETIEKIQDPVGGKRQLIFRCK